MIRIGTAGWSIPAAVSSKFPKGNGHLERYAGRFNCAEINSTFYRAHKDSTFSRWADSVPDTFRFSVKIPKEITHEQKLVDVEALLDMFVLQVRALGPKLGCLLVQIPPKLAYDARIAADFFRDLRQHFDGPVAFEPRHPSWFTSDVTQMLTNARISRVGADPSILSEAAIPGGDTSTFYIRLHGSPHVYFTPYTQQQLIAVSSTIALAESGGAEVWCIFDNTASGAAASDACRLQALLAPPTFALADVL